METQTQVHTAPQATLQPKLDKVKKAVSPTKAKALRIAGFTIEALSVCMSIFWAYTAQSNQFLAIIFCTAFAAFVIAKTLGIDSAIQAWQQRRWGVFIIAAILALMSLFILLLTSVFNQSNEAGKETQQAIAASLPAAALQKQIEITQQKLDGLSMYADAQQAIDEKDAIAVQRADIESKSAAITEQIIALQYPPFPSKFSKWMHEDCTPKTNPAGVAFKSRAEKACPQWKAMTKSVDDQKTQLQAQLHSIRSQHIVGSGYAAQHEKYNGLNSHLATLLDKQAKLSAGGTVTSVYSAEDKIISEFFNVSLDKAASVKWLYICILFDCMGFLLHSLVSLIAPPKDEEAAARKKLNILLSNGFNVNESLAALGTGSNAALATVSRPHQKMEELNSGGLIHTDGAAYLHANEAVLNPQAVQYLATHAPDLINQLNALQDGKTNTESLHSSLPSLSELNQITVQPPSLHKNQQNSVQRVSKELSGIAGKGRMGKVDKCVNPACGADFLVTKHNKIYCTSRCAKVGK